MKMKRRSTAILRYDDEAMVELTVAALKSNLRGILYLSLVSSALYHIIFMKTRCIQYRKKIPAHFPARETANGYS